MQKFRCFIKRAVFSALFFSFHSCSNLCQCWDFFHSCSNRCQCWDYEQTITPCCLYNSRKLFWYPQNEFRGLGLEIVRGTLETRMYLNIYCLSFPQELNDPSKTLVTISTESSSQNVLAERFEGGQRLLLPQKAADDIICALLNNETLTISSGRHCSEIPPDGFAKNFFRMLNDSF